MLLAEDRQTFYDQIKSLKNVLIADPTEYGLEYVKKSVAVASITGTSAWRRQ